MTCKVRIIIAMYEDGTYDVGCQATNDCDAIAELVEHASDPMAAVAYYALTAYLEVPDKVTIREVKPHVKALKGPGQ